jgi:2-methylcitrate dehydratase PrpD
MARLKILRGEEIMQDSTIRNLAQFAVAASWAELPASIVNETKMLLMDSIGCALAALSTDKGKANLALAKRFAGPTEASILGTDSKVSLSTAAMVNGELMFALDFTASVAGGNEPSFVIPAILAMAESAKASGKDLILSTAVGLEISTRLARAVLRQVIDPAQAQPPLPLKLRRTGNAYSNFGAAAGVGRLLKLDPEKMAHALGIAGHMCQVLTHGRYGSAGQRWSVKYGVPGWQSTGAITAALYAEMGYTGDLTQLNDSDNGFWYFAGYQGWRPENISVDLGRSWLYNYRMHYKPYPCCALFHGTLDCFNEILQKNDLQPQEIESVHVFGRVGMDHPLYGNPAIKSLADAQFNPRYMFAVAAHGIPPGVEWVSPSTMNDPEILGFMKKVTWEEYHQPAGKGPASPISRCDVAARGQTFTSSKQFSWGTVGTPAAMSASEIEKKFRHNAASVLSDNQIESAVQSFMNLENINDAAQLLKSLTRRKG